MLSERTIVSGDLQPHSGRMDNTLNTRLIAGVYKGASPHWVGDGFRVSNFFPSGAVPYEKISPFFLMDYHAPHAYPPSERPRGVGSHPHRGFETVTIAFEGSVAHHDSKGNSGVIGPGDVQWMTAASGILHKEYHEAEFSRRGGTMHMMQLWVNLPKADKMSAPRYQAITAEQIAKVPLPQGEVRVIAGEYRGARGPAKTFSPINLWEVRLQAGGKLDVSFSARQNTALLVMQGEVKVQGERSAKSGELVLFENEGEAIEVEAQHDAQLLLLNGEPLDEPVFAYGPFVMTNEQEIRDAISDFQAGKFGSLA
jgi:redox-sensitive bicupin YhaK (pirin superfamily)